MTDRPRPARPGPPAPARPKESGARRAPSPAADGAGKPTPVRPSPPEETKAESRVVRFEVGDEVWLARVVGRSGAAAGRAPLLLVEFEPEASGESDGGSPSRSVVLEGWIVGTDLGAISHVRLGEQLREARPRERRKSRAADGRRRRNR